MFFKHQALQRCLQGWAEPPHLEMKTQIGTLFATGQVQLADSRSLIHVLHVLSTFVPLAPAGFPIEAYRSSGYSPSTCAQALG